MRQPISSKDITYALITGLTTGIILWRLILFLEFDLFGLSVLLPIIVVPIIWLFGVWLGYFLGGYLSFFSQFGKFAVIGFTNAAVDFGVLNLLISLAGKGEEGVLYSIFKALSFTVAFLHSYTWNKYWAFNASNSGGGAAEFGKFLIVSLLSLVVNVGAAALIVNVVGPLGAISNVGWANVGAAFGSAAALVFNFIGYRLVVFSRKRAAL